MIKAKLINRNNPRKAPTRNQNKTFPYLGYFFFKTLNLKRGGTFIDMGSVWYYTIFMDENTVFRSPQNPNQETQPNPPQDPSVSQTSQVRQPIAGQPPTPPLQEQGSPPPQSSSPLGTIIKVVIGLLVVLFLAFIVFGLILPRLQKSDGKAEITYWGLWEDSNVMQSCNCRF